MIIQEVVNLAKYSELSGVAAKGDIDAITAFVNLGMLELYTRFPIHVEEYVLTLVDGTSVYTMPTGFMYATRAYGESTKTGVLKAIPLTINEDEDPYGIFFTSWNTIQVDEPATDTSIYIDYVAKPVFVTSEEAEDGVTELDLPDTLIDALLSYIGYRAHLGIRSDSQSENNSHWLRFERSCKKARELGVAFPIGSMSMLNRIADRGFA